MTAAYLTAISAFMLAALVHTIRALVAIARIPIARDSLLCLVTVSDYVVADYAVADCAVDVHYRCYQLFVDVSGCALIALAADHLVVVILAMRR